MIGKFQQKYQFWDGFGKGFGKVWEGLEGIKIRWKKDVKIRGIGTRVPIAALGRNLYRGGTALDIPPFKCVMLIVACFCFLPLVCFAGK